MVLNLGLVHPNQIDGVSNRQGKDAAGALL